MHIQYKTREQNRPSYDEIIGKYFEKQKSEPFKRARADIRNNLTQGWKFYQSVRMIRFLKKAALLTAIGSENWS